MIDYVNLSRDYLADRKNILKIIDKSLKSGNWVGGDDIFLFEKNISKYTGSKYCVALNSGTDALTLSLYILGIKKGDEVITTPNSFIASTAVIMHLGAKPVFVDVDKDQNIDVSQIEKKITNKTKAILPVHLTGKLSNMHEICKISKKYKLKIVEDAAQAIGSKYKKKHAGTFGDIGCFSAHPLKNLNALGDAGYLITSNQKYYNRAKKLINHGMKKRGLVEEFGFVSRMDNIQAAVLNHKIKNLDNIIKIRQKNAKLYSKLLSQKFVEVPFDEKGYFSTYHTFVIKVDKRDLLKNYLFKNGISTSIHYPIPIHLQKASRSLGYKKGDFPIAENQSKRILTLPINQHLSEKNIRYIANKINKFYEQ
ncbi:DegT/DnrJ/EryC1/StrS family aminotransferase [Alphaproteobacteria bacterium]|nr:DegT/DnrJ/EryC1/StrS family aminotransferase [Alphaproteobacteria bacterium]